MDEQELTTLIADLENRVACLQNALEEVEKLRNQICHHL